MKKLAIVGASGHGKVVADLAELCGYQVVFFDDTYPNKTNVEHWQILGTLTDLLNRIGDYPNAIVAIGNNSIRCKLSNDLLSNGFKAPVLTHPSATVSKYATIKEGTVIFAHAVVNAFAKIETNCIINTSVIVEHDCVVGNSVHLSPSVALAGGTKIGELSWLGIGSVTKQLIEIGSNSIIGANSTVINNIPANVTVVGSPTVIKKIK